MEKRFDRIVRCKFNDKTIEHGIILGCSTILIIKVGQGGSIFGFNDRYLKMAHSINSKYGATVICSANPFDGKNPLDVTFNLLDAISEENGWDDYRTYYMGVSNGGLVGAWYGYLYPIEKMLLVNMPIQVRNYNYTIDGLRASTADDITLVYGEWDGSCLYLPLLNELFDAGEAILEIMPGQDHNFTFGMGDFLSLPEIFLFKNDLIIEKG